MAKDLNLLRLLIVLNEEKQTVAAARRLNVSQPTVSVMLRKLREQFGDPLFVRDKNQLEPTLRCQQILQNLDGLLDSIDALYVSEDSWDISTISRHLTLVFTPPLMSTLAAPIIKRLSNVAPNITIDCYHWNFDALRDIELKQNCWGFSPNTIQTNKNILQKEFGKDEFVLVMRKAHALAQGGGLQEILNYPLCVNLVYGDSTSSSSEQIFRSVGISKPVSVRTSDVTVMLNLVECSNYVGIISKYLVESLGDRFVYIPIPTELPPEAHIRPLSIFTHQRNRHDPLTKWLHQQANSILS